MFFTYLLGKMKECFLLYDRYLKAGHKVVALSSYSFHIFPGNGRFTQELCSLEALIGIPLVY